MKEEKKVYVTMNIIPHNDDLIGLEEYSENYITWELMEL